VAGGPVVPGRFRSTQAVQDWVRSHDARQLCTTAITVAEIGYGIERLPGGRRKEILRAAAAKIFETFAEQVLPFDTSAAEPYGLVVSQRDRLSLPIDGFDAQIAAICRARGGLATRHLADFDKTGVEVINLWHPESCSVPGSRNQPDMAGPGHRFVAEEWLSTRRGISGKTGTAGQ
jgi:toxin FitB